MVKGLETFATFFRDFENAYVLIGGAACDVWLGASGLRFRATKDLDIVLIVETVDAAFLTHFWSFIRAGRYESLEQSEHRPEFYRFVGPASSEHPFMIELLTRNHLNLPEGVHLTPIPADEDISNLSAILLNDEYYRYVIDSRVVTDGVPIVPANCLIPLKARAWLDLTQRREAGENVKGDDIKKHRNDVFRLYLSLAPNDRFALPEQLGADLKVFLSRHPPELSEWQAIRQAVGIAAMPEPAVVLEQIRAIFML
jgi:hypothetical protein